jgi:hypothetical protein
MPSVSIICHQAFITSAENRSTLQYIKLLELLHINSQHPMKMHDMSINKRSWYRYCPNAQQDFTTFINLLEDSGGVRSFSRARNLFLHYAYTHKIYVRVTVSSSEHIRYKYVEIIKDHIIEKYKIDYVDVVNEVNTELIGGLIISYTGVYQDFSLSKSIHDYAEMFVNDITFIKN